MKNILTKIVTYTLVGLILFVVLKGCVISIARFDAEGAYIARDPGGHVRQVFVRAGNYVILEKRLDDRFEAGLYFMRGSEATHYAGPVYRIGDSPIGLRIYPDAKEVFDAELELIATHGNLDESTFGKIGKTARVAIVLKADSIVIEGDKYLLAPESRNAIAPAFAAFSKVIDEARKKR